MSYKRIGALSLPVLGSLSTRANSWVLLGHGSATPLFVLCVGALAIKSKRTYQAYEQARCVREDVCWFDSDSRHYLSTD